MDNDYSRYDLASIRTVVAAKHARWMTLLLDPSVPRATAMDAKREMIRVKNEWAGNNTQRVRQINNFEHNLTKVALSERA